MDCSYLTFKICPILSSTICKLYNLHFYEQIFFYFHDVNRVFHCQLILIFSFLQVAMNPKNTVFDAKRLIGRKFDDSKIQEDIKLWPFTVISDGGKPKIQVEYKGEVKRFAPEEISSMVLTKMREIAEVYLGKP